ncbi:MAG: DUF1636 domain-containing protein [Alphaproteobacteria bacterium]|nr:DUF1636 domain-containing protein [Alphaproteobacteria bacterium]
MTVGTPPICLSVCMRCRPDGWKGDDERRPGALLVELIAQFRHDVGAGKFVLREIRCMSQCRRPCVVALSGENRFTYLFGDLMPYRDAAAVLDLLKLYGSRPDGYMARGERPGPMRAGILGRIPPLGSTSALVHREIACPASTAASSA